MSRTSRDTRTRARYPGGRSSDVDVKRTMLRPSLTHMAKELTWRDSKWNYFLIVLSDEFGTAVGLR